MEKQFPNTMKNSIKPIYTKIDWVLLVCVSIAWGSADILAKKGLKIFSPNEVGIIRIFVASVVFTPFAIWSIRGVSLQKIIQLMVVGLLGSILPAFLFARSQAKLDSWITTAFNSLTPIFALVVAKFVFNRHISKNEIIGMLVGCIGTVILVSGLMGSINGDISYVIFPILGSLCYAISTNLVNHYLRNINIFSATAISLMPYAVVMGVLLFTKTEVIYKLQTVDGAYKALCFVLAVALLSSTFAFLGFNILTRNTSPIFASMAKLIAPVVSIVCGSLNGELLLPTHCLGIFTILFGVYILNKRAPSKSLIASDSKHEIAE